MGTSLIMLSLAQLVRTATGVIASIIVVAILLRVFDANAGNALVSFVHDLARALVGPFNGVFSLDNAKTEIAVNWGLAAVVWSAVGGLVASAIARAGLAGDGPRTRPR